MNIINNEKLIKRNARIGQITSLVSLFVLGGGIYVTFQMPDKVSLSLTALLVGFFLSQIGIYFTNKWGRPPLPHESITKAVKGLDKRYTLYNYTSPASHLLVGPAGIWALVPKPQSGKITFEKNRYRQKGLNIVRMYMRIFAQDGIGRPEIEASTEKEAIEKYLKKKMGENEYPEIRSAIIFTNPDAELDFEETPVPSFSSKKVKDFLRKETKANALSMETVKEIQEILGA